MNKGLSLLRLLGEHTEYRVLGADTDPLACGRVSKWSDGFLLLRTPSPDTEDEASEASERERRAADGTYTASLLRVIEDKEVDLWVSCSGVSSALLDAYARDLLPSRRPQCRSIQFSASSTATLHAKDAFIRFTESCGLPVPQTYEVRSTTEVFDKLAARSTPSQHFILKPLGVVDAFRADMTLLPRPSDAETRSHIARLPITSSTPWLLQEFVRGPEFCTHALVVRGKVRAFVACPSSEMLMHYRALPPESPLSKAMLAFTRTVAARLQEREQRDAEGAASQGQAEFSGHLSFDFLLREDETGDGRLEKEAATKTFTLLPIECNPRAHTAVVLFRDTPALARAYAAVLEGRDLDHDAETPITPETPRAAFWIAHDLITLLFVPFLQLLRSLFSPSTVPKSQLPHLSAAVQTFRARLTTLLENITTHTDAALDPADPLPALWLYHVYWPARLAAALRRGARWSRINASTGKMFGV